jgi:hypothetical protein
MDFTSSCTEETAASVVSTGVAVTSVTGAATVVVGVVVAVVAFLADLVVLGVSVATGAATTGVAATGVVVVFLETVLDLGAEAFIILEAVELFMAGIRTIKKCLESIFDPTFIFGRVQKFLSTSSQSEPLNRGHLRVLFYLLFNYFRPVSRYVIPSTTLYEYKK